MVIRTQIYLTDDEKRQLESVSAIKGISQSDLIRQAIDDLLSRTANADKSDILDSIAGIWKDNDNLPDIRSMRSGGLKPPYRKT